MTKSERKKSKSKHNPTSTEQKSSRPSRSLSKRKKKSAKKANIPGNDLPSVSEEEYLSLPLCIQRKYFSSLERLHIAYSSVHQLNPPIGKAHPRVPSANPTTPIVHRHSRSVSRSPTSLSAHNSHSYVTERHADRRRVNSSQISFGDVLATQAEAQWFTSLPEKVRSQLFDREEQELLFAALEPYTASRQPEINGQTNHLSSHHRTSPTPYKSSSTPQPSSDRKSSQRKSHRYSRRNKTPVEDNMENPQTRHQTEKETVRRRLTITRPRSSGIWTTSPSSPIPKSPIFGNHRRDRSQGTLQSLTRPSIDTAVQAIDPEAVYYRSPEARDKLRQYLASPQKFDEALTYGFPSDARREQVSHSYRYPYSTAHNDAKAFLNHDSISLIDDSTISDPDLEDEQSCETSDNGTDSPATPADANFTWQASQYNRLSIFGGLNTDSMPSLNLKFQPEPLSPIVSSPTLSTVLLNREMTLRMTLTRPDLRANEEELYGWRKSTPEDDPLALEELPTPIEDTSGAQGAFAVPPSRGSKSSKKSSKNEKASKGGFSRLWSKLRGH